MVMAVYSYRCPECNSREVLEISVHEMGDVVVRCRDCDVLMARDWRADQHSVIFKGSGFYRNDSRE